MNPFQAALARVIAGLSAYTATRPVALNTLYLARFLPPVTSTLAEIQAGSFRIITEPAALTAVDSPYAKVGDIQAVEFSGRTFKLTAESKLNESLQDAMHAKANAALLRAAQGQTGGRNPQQVYEDFIAREVVENGVMLSLDFGEEVFRAIALAYGKISVKDSKTGNGVDLDFGVPADQQSSRTGADAYDKASSKFWDDVQAARQKLNVEPVAITDPTTFQAILNNQAHGVIAEAPVQLATNVWSYRLSQAGKDVNGNYNLSQRSLDYRRSCTIISYGARADKPGAPYFWPTGRVTFVRTTERQTELIDGQIVAGGLGVTHIGPNTEAGQASTRYSNIYTPEGAPYEVIARGAEDVMPYIDQPRNLFLAKTEIGV